MTDQEQARLRDIVELQPTSNGELQAAWGLDESAAVHHYLERALADLYYRDSENMIRATDDATEQLSN